MSEETLSELVGRYFPNLSEEESTNLLFSSTCFPFGNFEKIEENLKELVENTDGTVDDAIRYSYKQLDEIMNRRKLKNQ